MTYRLLYHLDRTNLSFCPDRDVPHSIKELRLWQFHRFLHGLDGANLALHHTWHINDLVKCAESGESRDLLDHLVDPG